MKSVKNLWGIPPHTTAAREPTSWFFLARISPILQDPITCSWTNNKLFLRCRTQVRLLSSYSTPSPWDFGCGFLQLMLTPRLRWDWRIFIDGNGHLLLWCANYCWTLPETDCPYVEISFGDLRKAKPHKKRVWQCFRTNSGFIGNVN